MRKNLDNIEIVEPPIEELTKKRSWKGACFTGCGFLVLFIIIIVVGVRLYVGPGPQLSKVLPPNFPADIPVYDKDNIEGYTSISARYKERGLGISTLLPKLLLSPIFYNSKNDGNGGILKNLWQSVSTKNTEHHDSIQVEWKNLDAEPSFIVAYYKKELRKKKFTIDVETDGKVVRQFSFSRTDGISGSLYAQGEENTKPGTTYMLLTVNLAK